LGGYRRPGNVLVVAIFKLLILGPGYTVTLDPADAMVAGLASQHRRQAADVAVLS